MEERVRARVSMKKLKTMSEEDDQESFHTEVDDSFDIKDDRAFYKT